MKMASIKLSLFRPFGGAARIAASGLALLALTGCGAAQDMFGASIDHVPESASVESAPYPSLAHAPDPEKPLNKRQPGARSEERRQAAELRSQMGREASRMRAEARRMDKEDLGDRRILTKNQRTAQEMAKQDRAQQDLARKEADVKSANASEAARLRAEIEAELDAAFGDDEDAQ